MCVVKSAHRVRNHSGSKYRERIAAGGRARQEQCSAKLLLSLYPTRHTVIAGLRRVVEVRRVAALKVAQWRVRDTCNQGEGLA